jgi:hypothetical protein
MYFAYGVRNSKENKNRDKQNGCFPCIEKVVDQAPPNDFHNMTKF